MQKDVQVEYPKLKKKAGVSKLRFGVSEPVRKTLHDIFMENLKVLDRVTYIHRIIYAGKHKSPTQLPIMFKTTISAVNDGYCRERLTGFLLIYSTFFVHVVEGSEDAISKHLGILLETPADSKCVGEMKLLIQISNVLKRLCPEWLTYHATSPKLLTSLDENATVENAGQTLYKCLKQTYETIKIFIRSNDETSGVRKSPISYESRSNQRLSPNASLPLSDNIPSTSAQDKDQYCQHLPEMELVEALVESPYTQTLESYYQIVLEVPQREIYEDKVWPIPCDVIPYDIFSTIYDNVTELTERSEDSKQKSHDNFSKETEFSRKDHESVNRGYIDI